MYPTNLSEITQARQEDLLREADNERLIKIIQDRKPTLIEKIQIKISKLLGKGGKQLENQSNPQKTAVQGIAQN